MINLKEYGLKQVVAVAKNEQIVSDEIPSCPECGGPQCLTKGAEPWEIEYGIVTSVFCPRCFEDTGEEE